MINMTAREYMKNEIEKLYAENLRAISYELYKGFTADLDERLVKANIRRAEALESIDRCERLKNGDQTNVHYWHEES